MMWNFLREVGSSFLDLIYTPLCLHCDEPLDRSQPLFCSYCLPLLIPINPIQRCPFCFSSDFDPQLQKCCDVCMQKPPSVRKMASVFDYEGPASTLIKKLKYGGQPYLAEGAGAYLAAQFVQLDWPMPDCIVPMPMPALRKVERGYNQSLLLAKSLAAFLDCPVYDLLRRRSGEYSQAGLNHEQRMLLQMDSFSSKSGIKLYDQTVLLVDDVMTTGSSINRCADLLYSLYPKDVYALTVCRAM